MGTEAPLRSAIHAMVLYAFFWSSPPLAYGQTMSLNGMVVSPHPMSAQAGLLILQQGGNAFDAAVATAATAAVVDRIANGSLGGVGGYAMIYHAETKRVRALDYVGAAPRAARLELFLDGARLWDTGHPSRDSFRGPVVPGNLAALAALLETYGTMSWSEVLAPAIEYAEKGVAVTPRMHDAYAGVPTGRYPYGASIWYEKDGRPVPVGGILKQTDLAATLRRIARDGPGVLYGGELAEQIVAYFEEKGGIFTIEDFAEYRALWRDPIVTSYREFEVYGHPPGSGGMTVLQTLNILEHFDVAALGHNTPDFLHLMSEALKLAFIDDDLYNTGKDYAEIPLDRLLSKEYSKARAARIDLDKAQFYPAVKPGSMTSEHTINHTVVDRHGNVVTMTQTSMQPTAAVPGTGIAFNSGMSYFSLDPDDINVIEGGQRPRFVMSPTIVLRHGRPYLALGSGGGWTIPQTVLQVLVRVLDFDLSAHEAVTAPRFALFHLANAIPYMEGTDLQLERGVLESAQEALTARGHRLRTPGGHIGLLNAIRIDPRTGVLSGGGLLPEAYVAAW